MRVLVVGATGRTGRRIVSALAGAAHQVIAMGRSAEATHWPDGVTAHAADAMEPHAFDLIDRDTAVVTALSIPRASRSPFAAVTGPANLHSHSTRALVTAMQAKGARRLIKMSAQGVGDSAPRAGFGFRALVHLSNLRPAFEDHAIADAWLAKTDLDYTVVRPPMLADAEPTLTGLVGRTQGTTFTWTRVTTGDVATWITTHLTDPETFRCTLTLGAP